MIGGSGRNGDLVSLTRNMEGKIGRTAIDVTRDGMSLSHSSVSVHASWNGFLTERLLFTSVVGAQSKGLQRTRRGMWTGNLICVYLSSSRSARDPKSHDSHDFQRVTFSLTLDLCYSSLSFFLSTRCIVRRACLQMLGSVSSVGSSSIKDSGKERIAVVGSGQSFLCSDDWPSVRKLL